MKKIVFSVTNDIVQDRRMIRICNTLQNAGYDVTLVGRLLQNSRPLKEFSFKTHRIKCIYNKGPKFYAEYNIRLYYYLKKLKADIYGAVDYDTLKAVTRAAGSRGKKVIFDAHEWFEEVPELEGRDKVKRYWQKIARKGIEKTNLRYTVSQGIAKKLGELYGKSFEVIHNCPPLREKEPGSVREELIVYVGVLNKGRGLAELIKTMPQINAKLWLVGEGDIREELWRLATDENVLDKVIFKGFVPPEELEEILLRARVGVNLLDGSSLSYKYSLANKFFDYVHAGLPQVFMDFPEYQSFYKQHRVGAGIYDLKSTSIAYAINHLIEDRNYWFNIHCSCLEARKEWSWQREETKLLNLVGAM